MPSAISISSRSVCSMPSPSVTKACDSSNAVVANTTWPSPTPGVRNPPGINGDACVVAALCRAEADGVEAGDEAVERFVVASVEADEHAVVGRAGLDDDAVGFVVVAPGHRARRSRCTGDEADGLTEERGQRRRVGNLDPQVGELQLVVHQCSLWSARKSSEITASACASITSGAWGSMPERRRHSGARTNIVGPASVRM